GVTRVSYCPIEVVASCASSRSSPIVEGVTDSGTSRRSPKPKPSAVSRSCSSPRSTPSCAKEVLQDCRSASASVEVSSGPQGSVPPEAWLFITAEEFGSCQVPGPGISESAVYCPDSSAAEATTSLNAEPGGERSPRIGTLGGGRPGS